MGKDWYEMIAGKLGGYKKNWTSTVKGISGEDVFEERLIRLLQALAAGSAGGSVLDAGCAHGEFTLQIAPYAREICGFDFSPAMIEHARQLLAESDFRNVTFVHALAKELPFSDGQFDLIYSRRGPTSFLYESRVLKQGGIVIGIHSGAQGELIARLQENGFTEIQIEEFVAYEHFPTELDFARFASRTPGSFDYLAAENRQLLQDLIREHTTPEGLVSRQWRYIWQAVKR